MDELTTEQAERLLTAKSVKKTKWQKGAGVLFRIYKVPPGINTVELPLNFQVLFTDDEGYLIISEIIPI